jgi:hypothetical protein
MDRAELVDQRAARDWPKRNHVDRLHEAVGAFLRPAGALV